MPWAVRSLVATALAMLWAGRALVAGAQPPEPPLPDASQVTIADYPRDRDKASDGSADREKPAGASKQDNGGKDNADKDNGGKDNGEKDEKPREPERINAFGQATVISQWHGDFHSPYVGANSLRPVFEWATSATATLFLGGRLWDGGAVYFAPEAAGGLGFDNVTGIAGFPNGDITRVAKPEVTPYVSRLYFAQTFGLGGPEEKVESGPDQLAGARDVSRITVAVGKMAVTDWFDLNRYSHDPRTQFMNWSLMYNGAWDYPADVRGYDYGGVIEWNEERFALRYGLFGEPLVANGPVIDPRFGKAHGQVWELEYRYTLMERPGKVRGMFYLNRADMGNYRQALQLSPVNPDVTQTRTYDSRKYGFGLNLEQELSDDVGAFARLGWNDGHTETWAFTEIDSTASFGLTRKGTRWSRPDDVLGCAVVVNGLSSAHRDYLAAGGLGFIIGDGRLSYSPETIIESYYSLQLKKGFAVTSDLQLVFNPADNRDRGPVAIGTVRVHAEF
jgi:high affinity Mn2+ porin